MAHADGQGQGRSGLSCWGRLLPRINAAFGLAPEQIARLAPDRRVVVYKAITSGGAMLVGKVVTRELVPKLVQLVGVRLTAWQAAKFVPSSCRMRARRCRHF